MATVTIQKPTDQPSGRSRLLETLRACLLSEHFKQFRLMVAFARVGPLRRLQSELSTWMAAQKQIKAIFGIDEKGTTKEALEFAMAKFSECHVAHVEGPFTPTFHPKIYLFSGDRMAVAIVGSNNLTVGGTETNFESHLRIDLELPADASLHGDLISAWQDGLAVCSPLTPTLLGELLRANLVVPEALARPPRTSRGPSSGTLAQPAPFFPEIDLVPASSIPRTPATPAIAVTLSQVPPPSVNDALVIQIVPHPNGEVFLSKTAINQDPAFFGWPFTGSTTPKRANNQPYPQRIPDPVVILRVFDTNGTEILRHDPLNLNTVYYEPKSEIRITVPPDVVGAVPELSILVMRMSQVPNRDYEMDIFVPGSRQYTAYLARCNQTMPSGGRARARRFGWL